MSYQKTITPDQRRDFEERRRYEAQARKEAIEADARRRIEERRKAAEAKEREDILNGNVSGLKLDRMPQWEPNTEGLPAATAQSMRDVSIQALQIRMKSVFDKWCKAHPEFEDTPENRSVIVQFLGRNHADVTERNLNACLPLFNTGETVKPKYTEAELNRMSAEEYKSAMKLKSVNSQDARVWER